MSEINALNYAPLRRILRFGQQVRGNTIASIAHGPAVGPGGYTGRLVGAALLPEAHQAWLRLSSRGPLPWQQRARVVALGAAQPAQPPADALALHSGLRAHCHDGYVGRIEGLSVDATSGRVLDVLLRVRTDVLAEVDTAASPFNALLRVAGQVVMFPPEWITDLSKEEGGGLLGGNENVLELAASPEQIASGMLIRPDGDLIAAIWRLWEENPAITAYLDRIRPLVHDGDVTLVGSLPAARQKASAEQDVWHVPGVFSVVNDIRVG
ncbi:MAG TPA: BON domain-containing protein [Ktedonobacterales bacterium]